MVAMTCCDCCCDYCCSSFRLYLVTQSNYLAWTLRLTGIHDTSFLCLLAVIQLILTDILAFLAHFHVFFRTHHFALVPKFLCRVGTGSEQTHVVVLVLSQGSRLYAVCVWEANASFAGTQHFDCMLAVCIWEANASFVGTCKFYWVLTSDFSFLCKAFLFAS